MQPRFLVSAALLIVSAAVIGCSGSASLPGRPAPASVLSHGSADAFMRSITPKSASPASIAIPPMQGLSGTRPAMSVREPQSEIAALTFSQLPGAAVYVAASPDGTFWVLSTQGLNNGIDKFIYHYVNGTYVNVPGAASRIAVGPDSTPWVLNSAGGIYHLVNGSFLGIAGGASELSVGGTASAPLVDVISNQAPGPYGAGIYQYNVNAGTWSQLPGAGVTVAASIDSGTYPALNINPGGFYVTNAGGGIFYYNVGVGFEQLPGGAIRLAPTAIGGIFALGDPTNPVQHGIYYNDLNTGQWTQMPGAAVSISANSQDVYAIGAAGGIYVSPISGLSTPNPLTGTLAATFCNTNLGTNGCTYTCNLQANSFCGLLENSQTIAIDVYTSFVCNGGATGSVGNFDNQLNFADGGGFLPGFTDGCGFPAWTQKTTLLPEGSANEADTILARGNCTLYPQTLCIMGLAYAAVPSGASPPPQLSAPQVTWSPIPTPSPQSSSPAPGSTPTPGQGTIGPNPTPPPDDPVFSPGAINVYSASTINTVAISQADYGGPFAVSAVNPDVGSGPTTGCSPVPAACFQGCAYSFYGALVLQGPGTVSFQETGQWSTGNIPSPGYAVCYLYGYDYDFPLRLVTLTLHIYSQI